MLHTNPQSGSLVHACWSADHIEHLEARTGPGNTLTEQLVIDATTAGPPTHDAVETVLKGPEVHLDGVRYLDKDGHPREHARLRWWDSDATTLRSAVLIGQDAEKIARALDTVMPVHFAENMESAVHMAASCAESDDTVLLAPACASLDQYDNYMARGDAFIAAVEGLRR